MLKDTASIGMRTKVLLSILVVALLGGAATFEISGLFSATTQSTGDEITAGSVSLANNSAGQALFTLTGADPGDSYTRCIKVTYTGGLPSDVRMYLGGTPGPLAPYLNLKIEEGAATGSDTFPQCTTFVANDTIYDGGITADHYDYASGLPTYPGGVEAAWTTGSSTVYRVTVALSQDAPNSGQAQSSGILTAYWEAHNQ